MEEFSEPGTAADFSVIGLKLGATLLAPMWALAALVLLAEHRGSWLVPTERLGFAILGGSALMIGTVIVGLLVIGAKDVRASNSSVAIFTLRGRRLELGPSDLLGPVTRVRLWGSATLHYRTPKTGQRAIGLTARQADLITRAPWYPAFGKPSHFSPFMGRSPQVSRPPRPPCPPD